MINCILPGNNIDTLKTIPSGSVNCCITSPPYYGLRDYGTAQWEGGDPNCDHAPDKRGSRFATPVLSKIQKGNPGSATASLMRNCKCGAIRIDDQIGLEDTPDEYINKLIIIFREVFRILRDDGVLWLNIGDGYAGSRISKACNRIKEKDLIGVPWTLAFALRSEGWYLRQDIIWYKPNAMPESVSDRCTKSHEYLFLLSKSPRCYFNKDAIKERANSLGHGLRGSIKINSKHAQGRHGKNSCFNVPWSGKINKYRNKRDVKKLGL